MRNFIILFRGREGSSPIIAQLKTHPEITVPLFEELDYGVATRKWPDVPVSEIIDAVFSNGELPGQFPLENRNPGSVQGSVGFKWRFWGKGEGFESVMRRHDPVFFHLFRTNILESTASLYLSNVIVPKMAESAEFGIQKGGHIQFRLRDLPAQKQAELRQLIAGKRFDLPVDFAVERMAANLANKQKVEQEFLAPLSRDGADIYHIAYEDYVADPIALLSRICAAIGCSVAAVRDTSTTYKKVASRNLLDQVANLDELTGNDEIADLMKKSDALFGQRPRA